MSIYLLLTNTTATDSPLAKGDKGGCVFSQFVTTP